MTSLRTAERPGRFAVIALALALVGFLAHLTIELQLDRRHVFDQADVLFDADSNEVVDTFAAGGYLVDQGERQGFIHPGLRLFFTAPIKLAAFAIAEASRDENAVASWRRRLAMLVVPASAAMFYVLFFVILSRLGASTPGAALLTTFTGLSFGQLLFGSIPESFPISNLAVTAAFLLFVLPTRPAGRWRTAAWIAVGACAAGITITNIVPVAILMWFDGIAAGRGPVRSWLRTCAVSIAAVCLILSLNAIANWTVGIQRPTSEDTGFATSFMTRDTRVIARKLLTFPGMLATSIVAPLPRVMPQESAAGAARRYPFRFTFDVDRYGTQSSPFALRNLIGIVGVIVLSLGLLGLRRESAWEWRVFLFYSACVCVLAFNWAFHSFWGGERFLYSQHWQAALMFLLAGVASHYALRSRRMVIILAGGTLVVGANNLHVLITMFQRFQP